MERSRNYAVYCDRSHNCPVCCDRKVDGLETVGIAALREGMEELKIVILRGQILHSFTTEKFDLILYEVESFWETPFNNEPKKHADTMSVVSLNSIPYLRFSIILSM